MLLTTKQILPIKCKILSVSSTSENMGGSDRDSRPDEYNYSDLLKGFNVGQ